MGGQACILYGAAEFSRDVDVAVLASEKNLGRLRQALDELQAEAVYVPSLSRDVLLRGHACHFRVQIPEASQMRIDVMSVMHGCDDFEALWQRRRRILLPEVGQVNVLSLADLVQAKKTQRDRDWPMVRRLIEADYHNRAARPSRKQVEFWMREARTPELLADLCRKYPDAARRLSAARPAVQWALKADFQQIEQALREEENAIRAADRAYWLPLRTELEQWKRQRRRRVGE